jgi:hypothetical protein
MENRLQLYDVGKKVGKAPMYALYLCLQKEIGRQCLLQIANEVKGNVVVDRVAYILSEFARYAGELEEKYAENPKNAGKTLGYDLGFPELIDSFICQEQGGRRINVLAFRCVESVHDMIPIINITVKDRLRTDLRTSGWIMGKTLKMIDFAHSYGVTINSTRGNNILIEKDNHYSLIFDWSLAQIYLEEIPEDVRCRDISHAAQAAIKMLGGDWEKGFLPDDGEKAFPVYSEYLFRLAHGKESKAIRAHHGFYDIVDMFWKKEFYPFTTKPLNG